MPSISFSSESATDSLKEMIVYDLNSLYCCLPSVMMNTRLFSCMLSLMRDRQIMAQWCCLKSSREEGTRIIIIRIDGPKTSANSDPTVIPDEVSQRISG